MTSNKQLYANRANATKSTGPRSQAGKGRSRLNSRKHGLTAAHGLIARDIVIGDEDPEDFERLRMGLQADLEPSSTIALELVDRLAGLFWRLRRISMLEGALLDTMQEQNASTAQDYTLSVTPEQQRALIYVMHDLEKPEYKQFLSKFFGVASPTREDFEKINVIFPAPSFIEIGKILRFIQQEGDVDLLGEEAAKYPKTRHLRLRVADEESRRGALAAHALIKDAEKHDVLGKLSRYEASLANAVARTLSLLHSIQTSSLVARNDGETPPR